MPRKFTARFSQMVLAAGLALAATSVDAASLTAVSGTWVSTNDDDGIHRLNGLGTDYISWGAPVTSRGQSGYEFQSATRSGGVEITAGTTFDAGTFIHHNRRIWSTGRHTNGETSSISGARLRVDYALDFGDGELRRYSSVFDFLHDETSNFARTCANGANWEGINARGCSDRITLARNDELSDSFVIGDLEYQLDLTGLLGQTPFWTAEQAENSLELQGMFTTSKVPPPPPPPVPVPLPAGGLLLLTALAGAGAIGRRARRAGT